MPSSPPSPLVCPICLAQRRAQRTEYNLQAESYVCLVHGAIITTHLLFLWLTGVP